MLCKVLGKGFVNPNSNVLFENMYLVTGSDWTFEKMFTVTRIKQIVQLTIYRRRTSNVELEIQNMNLQTEKRRLTKNFKPT